MKEARNPTTPGHSGLGFNSAGRRSPCLAGPRPAELGRNDKKPISYLPSFAGEEDRAPSSGAWWWGFLLVLLLASPAHATPQEDARAGHLYTEIRCLVCQGESIADSDAAIAADLRREVRADIEKGMSDAEIRKSLYTRYGDYVLFRPRLSTLNLFLWFVPPLIAVAGIVWLVLRGRKQKKSENYALTAEEREKLDAVLKE